MIDVNGVSLTIGTSRILRDASLTAGPGEIVGLIGRNGSGKTMLLRCIAGLVRPTAGTVTADGIVVGRDRDFLPSSGIIIETPGFISYYSGMRNLMLLAGIRGKAGREEVREAVRLAGLDPDDRRPVRKYSLGMRQRLGIAQAVMEDPRYLLLDEPMNGLDGEGLADMRELFISLKNKGKTLIIASHSREDIEILCDRVYEMDKGQIALVR
ncbi:MAG: ATP-binding cassette domain-containing protein [Lachnospiraceae bacterium]|nr:ATP-binding cassette domain-containing protein [Lachnospiraceae bacterium]